MSRGNKKSTTLHMRKSHDENMWDQFVIIEEEDFRSESKPSEVNDPPSPPRQLKKDGPPVKTVGVVVGVSVILLVYLRCNNVRCIRS